MVEFLGRSNHFHIAYQLAFLLDHPTFEGVYRKQSWKNVNATKSSGVYEGDSSFKSIMTVNSEYSTPLLTLMLPPSMLSRSLEATCKVGDIDVESKSTNMRQ